MASLFLSAFEPASELLLAGDFNDQARTAPARWLVDLAGLGTGGGHFASGSGDDILVFDGNYAYQYAVLDIDSGDGADRLYLSAGDGQYAGSIQLHLGQGNDTLLIGHLEGNAAAAGLIDAGTGDDLIGVGNPYFDIAIFGNSPFTLLGGDGNDLFRLRGTVLNVTGESGEVVLNGGAGFDRLEWNLRYQLTEGGSQLPGLGTYGNTPYRAEVDTSNIELLLLRPDNAGTAAGFTSDDVRAITRGSDFDRASLGLPNLAGLGEVLTLTQDRPGALLHLEDWLPIGISSAVESRGYQVFERDGALLVVDPALLDLQADDTAPERILVDGQAGALLRLADLFATSATAAVYEMKGPDGQPVDWISLDAEAAVLRVSPTAGTPASLELTVTRLDGDGSREVRVLDLALSTLTFAAVVPASAPAAASMASGIASDPDEGEVSPDNPFMPAVGDVDGDGLADVLGYRTQADGSFTEVTPADMGLQALAAGGRVHRDARLVDLDNDGDLDLVANTYSVSTPDAGIAYVMLNDGAGHFTELASFSGLAVQGYGETIVTADFDNNGFNDFYITYYQRNDPAWAGGGAVAGSRLFLNDGHLGFVEATADWTISNRPGASLSLKGFGALYDQYVPEGAQALDFNHDGLVDLYAASHLFMNQGGRFVDMALPLGLPLVFDEGAKFFDWNNDGWLDLVLCRPELGPLLMQFDPLAQRFTEVQAFPAGRSYESAYGLNTGDFNGDGWDDLYVSGGATMSPRLYLNDQGRGFVEYRTQANEGHPAYAGESIEDLNGDRRPDLVLGGPYGMLINTSADASHAVEITLLGPDGERNQYGRAVQLHPLDADPGFVLTRVVDGGSGYMAQGDYRLLFTDAQARSYRANCYLAAYPDGTPVKLEFLAQSGHSYEVRSAGTGTPATVVDLDTGDIVPSTVQLASTLHDDVLDLAGTPSPTLVNLSEGNDSLTLHGSGANPWRGSAISGDAGDDLLVLDGNNAYTAQLLSLSGGAGNDTLRVATGSRQYAGAVQLAGGAGDDLIEVGHVEGSWSADAGIDGGDGNDTLRVLDTGYGMGVFGNGAFALRGGSGDDTIELQGRQFNLLGDRVNTADGGSGFDTLVWNGRYDLNTGTDQTGVDATHPAYAAEIGARNIERLDVAASGATGLRLRLGAGDLAGITAGSDFDRTSLDGLGLAGAGHTLFLKLGDTSNLLTLQGSWQQAGHTMRSDGGYDALTQNGELLLLQGGTLQWRWDGSADSDLASFDLGVVQAHGGDGDDELILTGLRAGSALEGDAGNDLLQLQSSNAYTLANVRLWGGDGNDTLRAATGEGQFAGAVQLTGGAGDDLIEVGHVEGSWSADAGIDGGDGNDTLRVLDTGYGMGVFGNGAFALRGGTGDDTIELQGMQYNLLGARINTVDGGAGFDTLVWNGRYDLNTGTDQTGVDATQPVYAAEIGARSIEHLDIAGSGATGLQLRLGAGDVAGITAGSDFERASLDGLGLAGTGHALLVDLGDASNLLASLPSWQFQGVTNLQGHAGAAFTQGGELLLVNGGAALDLGHGLGLQVASTGTQDTLLFNGSMGYTTTLLRMDTGAGDDTLRVATGSRQYAGAVQLAGGDGDDLIEVGHVEGSWSADAGIDGGAGNDTLRVLDTLSGIGVFGNGHFALHGGAGDDTIDLRGVQYNLLGEQIDTVDGGAGFDTLVWNGRYDLNTGTDQTGVDATQPVYAAEIGAHDLERLDIAGSGATGLQLRLGAGDVTGITAGSDFDRASLDGLGLTGTGHTLFVELGDASNVLTLRGSWSYAGSAERNGTRYDAYVQDDALVLVHGGALAFNAGATELPTALHRGELFGADAHVAAAAPAGHELLAALDLHAAMLALPSTNAGLHSWRPDDAA